MQPSFFDAKVPFQKGSAASQDGARVASFSAGSQMGVIYAAIQQHGPVSDRELVDLTGCAINIINARRRRLQLDGWIVWAGDKVGSAGAKVQTWTVR